MDGLGLRQPAPMAALVNSVTAPIVHRFLDMRQAADRPTITAAESYAALWCQLGRAAFDRLCSLSSRGSMPEDMENSSMKAKEAR